MEVAIPEAWAAPNVNILRPCLPVIEAGLQAINVKQESHLFLPEWLVRRCLFTVEY